jgi:acyl-[acyl carrier protein]--UDP-N-acetylglucosamine O-acyltransferase
MAKYIDPTALIGPNVFIDEDVYIGPYCIIGYPPEWKGKEAVDKGVIILKGTRTVSYTHLRAHETG